MQCPFQDRLKHQGGLKREVNLDNGVGKVSEKVVSNEGWSLVSRSLMRKHEGEGFKIKKWPEERSGPQLGVHLLGNMKSK